MSVKAHFNTMSSARKRKMNVDTEDQNGKLIIKAKLLCLQNIFKIAADTNIQAKRVIV